MATPDVTVQNTNGGQSADINLSMADTAAAAAAAANADPNTAASLGVTDAQFAKYYNATDKSYNWQAHATEKDFREKAAAPADAATEDSTPAADDAAAATAIGNAGLDFAVLESQVIDDGDIDAASYAALEAIGIPKEIVADYIEGVKDRATNQVADVLDAFGGDENLNKVKVYAQANYTMEEMNDLDAKLADPKQYKAVVDMLRHQAGILPSSTGAPVNANNSFGGGSDGVEGYASEGQMIADMRLPRYKTDATFRQEVTAKVAASNFNNNPRSHSGGL